jgi:hypothetical protein
MSEISTNKTLMKETNSNKTTNPGKQFSNTHRHVHIFRSCLHLRRKEEDGSEAGICVELFIAPSCGTLS